ncbi:MAG TPA: short-chain dehydrogenase [Actinobacteria bacterium]|nr:short-chain dehydrogenase [Actinomycetota bacterium]
MGIDQFRYDGRRALVVGGASGMGFATAQLLSELGAEVVIMDVLPSANTDATVILMDLRDRASIDAALATCGGPIDALFMCAGVADGSPGIERALFLGQRHLVERAIELGMVPRGSAIGVISSVAGLGWERALPELTPYLDTQSFESGSDWISKHPDKATYSWAKQAFLAYTARQAYPFAKLGIRINAILPGPTDTPLARANAETWLGFAADYREDLGVPAASAEDQAYPLVFLCSGAARHVNGISFVVDAGYVSSGLTGSWDAPFIKSMMGLE